MEEAATDALGGARVLVTGAQGLLGRHLVAALLTAGAESVLGVGRSPRRDDRYTHDLEWLGERRPAPLPDSVRAAAGDRRYAYAALDLADAGAVGAAAADLRPTHVVHAAAALRDAPWAELLTSNLRATVGLVEGLAAAGTRPRLVLTSSGSVYGAGRGAVPFAEDGPAEPLEPYGVTKRAGEDVARVAAAEAGLPLVVARVFNLVGAGLQDRHLPAVLAARVSAIARGLAPPELRLGALSATRDFVDVRDAADALVLLAGARDTPAVANVASGDETPVRAVLDTLLDLAGVGDVRVHEGAGRRAHVPRSVADVRRLRTLGFRPRHALRATLADMLAYFETFPAR